MAAAAAAAGTPDPIYAVAELVQQLQQLPTPGVRAEHTLQRLCSDSCICDSLPSVVQGVTDWVSAVAATTADVELQLMLPSLPELAARLLRDHHSRDSFCAALRLYTK